MSETKILDISFSEDLIKGLLKVAFKDDEMIQHISKQKMVGCTMIQTEDGYKEGNVIRFFFRETDPKLIVTASQIPYVGEN